MEQPMAVCRKDVNLRHPVGQCPYDDTVHPSTEPRSQRKRRVARWGLAWVRREEAKVDALELVPGGLCRENVLSLMEGMYSEGLADGKRGRTEDDVPARLRLRWWRLTAGG
jgi:hypothetical protein